MLLDYTNSYQTFRHLFNLPVNGQRTWGGGNSIKITKSNLFNYKFKKLNLKPKKSEMDQQLLATFFQFLEEKQRPFAATFFHFESLKILENKKWLDLYENESSAHFKNLLNQLNHYEIANAEIQKAEFKKNEQPLELLIDEIEKIWKPIAEHDDWSLFQNKIQSIRQNTVDSAQLI